MIILDANYFIKFIASSATKIYQKYGIYASLTISQACLETGYGSSMPVNSNNLFGIKWTGTGDYVVSQTKEYINGKWITINAKFRKYNFLEDSIYDHAKFLIENPRYKNVLLAKNGLAACQEIQKDGYATDPNYANQLINLINQYNLQQYDIKEVDNVVKEYFKIKVNGKIKYLQKELPVIEDHTYMSIRDLEQLLNFKIDYASNTINIITGGR